LPEAFTHGEVLQARRVRGLILARVRYAPGVHIPPHSHRHARFVFVLRGSFTETAEGRERHATPSVLLYRATGERHAAVVGSSGALVLIVDLDPTWLDEVRAEGIALAGSTEFRGGLLGLLCHRLVCEFHQRDEVARLAIESLVAGIAVEASRRLAKAPGRGLPRWLAEARALLQARFAERLTLDDVARVVGVHPVHLARSFRQAYHCTVGDYVRQLRLEFACRQVCFSDAPLSDVALAAGFCDQSHFSRAFKRHTGFSPAEYRKGVGSPFRMP
jgi:AraC family transcriptional regulator